MMNFLLHHTLRSCANRFPDKEALVDRERRLTFRQVERQAASLARSLRDAGIDRGQRIGVWLDPSIEQVVSIYAASQAGGVFVPMHQGLFPQQVEHVVRDCEMTCLITDATKLGKLRAVLGDLPSLELIVVVGEQDLEVSQPIFDFDEMCQAPPAVAADDRGIEKDLAAILYTSGSTGKPKGVMLSHGNVVAGASIVSDYLNITDRDRILAVLPFSFDAGLNQLTTAFQQGATLVLTTFLFAKDIVEKLATEEITGLAGVPSLWSLLAQPASKLRTRSLPHLRYITNTGGAMPQNVLAELRKSLPQTDVFLMYGLTEAFRSTYLPPAELDRRPGSMGKAIPNTEIIVVNEAGERCKPGEIGELVHHGPTVSLGYWGHPELTARVLRPHPFPQPGAAEPCKVVYSGDLVKQDEDGFLYFVGRRDNLIKSSGFRVSPTEVEEVLCQRANLCEAAVIGIPDDVLGQRIKAFVVAGESTTIDANQLLASCATAMPRHMVPKSIEVLESLPKTTSGKTNYAALREREGLI